MSTRCQIHFCEPDGTPVARIYRHTDGHPEDILHDLTSFYEAVEAHTPDHRYDDPEYLAAKFVVWQANINAHASLSVHDGGEPRMLDFLSVGVADGPHGDEAYFYRVLCSTDDEQGRPIVEYAAASAYLNGQDASTTAPASPHPAGVRAAVLDAVHRGNVGAGAAANLLEELGIDHAGQHFRLAHGASAFLSESYLTVVHSLSRARTVGEDATTLELRSLTGLRHHSQPGTLDAVTVTAQPDGAGARLLFSEPAAAAALAREIGRATGLETQRRRAVSG